MQDAQGEMSGSRRDIQDGVDGVVTLALGCNKGGWHTPDTAWSYMEVAEDGKIYFVNMIL